MNNVEILDVVFSKDEVRYEAMSFYLKDKKSEYYCSTYWTDGSASMSFTSPSSHASIKAHMNTSLGKKFMERESFLPHEIEKIFEDYELSYKKQTPRIKDAFPVVQQIRDFLEL